MAKLTKEAINSELLNADIKIDKINTHMAKMKKDIDSCFKSILEKGAKIVTPDTK